MAKRIENQELYPRIPVTAEVKKAVKDWADYNNYKIIKISEVIAAIPEIANFMKASK